MDISRFKITISGPGVLPETTRASDLAKLLINIETAISETAITKGVEIGEEDIISLTGIDKSSNKLTFAVTSLLLLSSAASVSEAVETKKYEKLPRKAHEALYEASKQVVPRNWKIKFVEDRQLGIKGGTISEENQVPPAPPIKYVEGTTTIYGRCIRVGGIEPKAEIRLYQGEALYIKLSEMMAKELAKSLYEEVCIEGRAKWNTEDWTLKEFEGVRVTKFKATDLVTAFKNLATASKGKWDGVDAMEYVKALRSEREEE
jgi:hypothetical protein